MMIILTNILLVLGVFLGLSAILGLIFLPIFLPIFFWFQMLIDCINRKFEGEHEKLLWILVIWFANFIGAILYYYCVKNKK